MERLLQGLRRRDEMSGPALVSDEGLVSAGELARRVDSLAAVILGEGLQSIALYADNGVDWVVADLAGQLAGVPVTPLPLFFSRDQLEHAAAGCGADALITDREGGAIFGTVNAGCPVGESCRLYRLGGKNGGVPLPAGTSKITFTSGTTGKPKGVCLSADHQLAVARSLVSAVGLSRSQHLCLLPLSTLLENVAGVYAPLLAGGTVIVPSLAETGLTGSSGLDGIALTACIDHHRPDSLILVPEVLKALNAAAEVGWRPPGSLQFVAVGGGRVAPGLLERAGMAGLPVYEGYGLSECGSVVSLNVPGARRPGSVGRLLPHAGATVVNGEIVVSGSAFLGYAGQPDSWLPDTVHTGDLGRVDDDGYVYIEGRSKNQLITSYGRNISPEWIESELLSSSLLEQAVVFGDARPYSVALLQPRNGSATDADIAGWVERTNRRLPDYARVLDWRRLPRPLSAADRTATENGRPRRDQIERKYRTVIDGMYEAQPETCSQ